MKKKNVISCSDKNCNHGRGNILFAMSGDKIFIKCRNKDCGLWTRVTIRIPGAKIDFNNAAITQETLPKGYHLDLEKATTVISE